MSVEVLHAGFLTTLQDRGRIGFGALGVGRAGAMDDVSARLANALVGNPPGAAALEITLIGPALRFGRAATIALTGAECPLRIGNGTAATWRRVEVAAHETIEIGHARRGARAYLAVAGGFAVDAVLGSASTDVNASIGPFGGRPLRKGDRLMLAASDDDDANAERAQRRTSTPPWSLDPRPWFDPDFARRIRIIPGPHLDALEAPSRAALLARDFRIAPDSNRVGFRLDGPRLVFAHPIEMISEPLAAGTLQLPPGGQPIALMAEHPTIGGYPRLGQIAAIDLPRLAQRRPSDTVRFAAIGLDDAQTRYLEREREIARLAAAIAKRNE